MRFPKSFRRQKNVGGSPDPALGSDAVPTTSPPFATQDNVLSCKLRDINGWPVQRIAACWQTAALNALAMPASLYFWEELTDAWYLLNDAPISMKPNQLYFFDTVTISNPSPTKHTFALPGTPSDAGSMDVMLVVTDPGAQVNGTFTFAIGPDLTAVGT